MALNIKQTLTVARFEIKEQIKSLSFWTMIIVPLLIIIYFVSNNHIIKINNNYMLGMFISLSTFIFCTMYIVIAANSVTKDKTNKISEIILSIVDAKEQIIGKCLGIYFLVIAHLLIYSMTINIYIKINNIKINENLNTTLLIYVFTSILCTLFMTLAWTMLLASYITDSTQTLAATMPAIIIVGEMTFMSMLFADAGTLNEDALTNISLGICLCIPPFGSVVTPNLILTNSISYLEAYTTLLIQFLAITFIFKKSISQYKLGLLSKKKVNILTLIFSKGERFK